MDGRSDLVLYQNGVRKLINFFPIPSGGVVRRAGTEFVTVFEEEKEEGSEEEVDTNVKNPIKKEDAPQQKNVRVMFPFVFSRESNFLIIITINTKKDEAECSYVNKGKLESLAELPFAFKPSDFGYVTEGGKAYLSFGLDYPVYELSLNIAEDSALTLRPFVVTRTLKQEGVEPLLPEAPLIQALALKRYLKEASFFAGSEGEAATYCRKGLDEIRKGVPEFLKNFCNGGFTSLSQRKVVLKALEDLLDKSLLYHNTLAIFNGRLWGLGTKKSMHEICASRVGAFEVFCALGGAPSPLDPIFATFSSGGFDCIVWSIPLAKELIVATTDGITILTERDRTKEGAVKVHKEIDISVSKIKPVILDKIIFFVGGDRRKIFSLYYSRERGGYQTSEVNVFAEHLFSDGIKKITATQSPFNMLTVVLRGGSFAAFIHDQELKLLGWSHHFLGGDGHVLDAVGIPDGDSDKIFFRVLRRAVEKGEQKEFLECFDCRNLTVKSFQIPHKLNYLDCYKNIQSDTDDKIDEEFEKIFSNEDFHETVAESELIKSFKKTKASVENIENNYTFNGVKVGILNETNKEKQAITSFIQEYIGNEDEKEGGGAGYGDLIATTIGLEYALVSLAEKYVGYRVNFLTGSREFERKSDDLLKELKAMLNTLQNNFKKIKEWFVKKNEQEQTLNGDIVYTPNKDIAFNYTIIKSFLHFDENDKKFFVVFPLLLDVLNDCSEKHVKADFVTKKREVNRGVLAKLNNAFLQTEGGCSKINLREFILTSTTKEDFFSQEIDRGKQELDKIKEEEIERDKQELDKINKEQNNNDPPGTLFCELFLKKKEEKEENIIGSYYDELAKTLPDFLKSVFKEDRKESNPHLAVFYFVFETIVANLAVFKQNISGTYTRLFQKFIGSTLKIPTPQEIAHLCLFYSKDHFPLWRRLFPDIDLETIKVFLRLGQEPKTTLCDEIEGIKAPYVGFECCVLGDTEKVFTGVVPGEPITFKTPAHYATIGFPYASQLQTFPFVFPDDYEHVLKQDVTVGLKVYNTKGGFLQILDNNGIIRNYEIQPLKFDIKSLEHYRTDKKLLIKETADAMSTPFLTGWVDFSVYTGIGKDVSLTFKIKDPYPVTLLKAYVKVKMLPHYRG
ncbi:MAG: hypothetical protein GY858_09850 [Candidatus Omnitrophica bacterium]|nr:hypothetical protein [Candidatus Omnitrophota bacterium]